MSAADPDAVAAFYGRWAGIYDLVARYTPGIGSMRERAVDRLGLKPGDTVLDMGCGTGANLPYLRERVGPTGRVIGVDLTPGMLARAYERIRREGWENVHLLRGDAARPPVAGSVDAVLASFVVGMFDDPAAVVDRWLDRLRPGGGIALLDAAPSEAAVGRALNPLFDVFTRASSPSKRRRAGERLARKVAAAREPLTDRVAEPCHETLGFGFIRLTSGRL